MKLLEAAQQAYRALNQIAGEHRSCEMKSHRCQRCCYVDGVMDDLREALAGEMEPREAVGKRYIRNSKDEL